MKSARRGGDTSRVEVSGISPHGVWLLLGETEVFLPFKNFPWFRQASIASVLHVERPQPHHLHWPGLDVDIAVESIQHPERYPLMSREKPRPQPKLRPKRRSPAPKAKAKRRPIR